MSVREWAYATSQFQPRVEIKLAVSLALLLPAIYRPRLEKHMDQSSRSQLENIRTIISNGAWKGLG